MGQGDRDFIANKFNHFSRNTLRITAKFRFEFFDSFEYMGRGGILQA
jgi:hypothetical protein